MGAANPIAAGKKILEIAVELGFNIHVAVVTGDDVLGLLHGNELAIETGLSIRESGTIISANAYMGADALMNAIRSDAQIIITGRIADPSLFVAPMAHAFGWDLNDTNLIAKATVIGHLLECAGQLTGGYFADGHHKQVPDLANLGHPFATIHSDASAQFSKLENTGGILNLATAKEQLLYEVMDPSKYITPDVIANFTTVELAETGINEVKCWGATGAEKPSQLKVSVGYDAGYLGEGEISYAGAYAVERAKLAGEIIQERLRDSLPDLQVNYIGINSVHGTDFGHPCTPFEVRLRVAAKTKNRELAALVGEEVEALYTNGPAGGGAARKQVNPIIGIHSILLDRSLIKPALQILHA